MKDLRNSPLESQRWFSDCCSLVLNSQIELGVNTRLRRRSLMVTRGYVRRTFGVIFPVTDGDWLKRSPSPVGSMRPERCLWYCDLLASRVSLAEEDENRILFREIWRDSVIFVDSRREWVRERFILFFFYYAGKKASGFICCVWIFGGKQVGGKRVTFVRERV